MKKSILTLVSTALLMLLLGMPVYAKDETVTVSDMKVYASNVTVSGTTDALAVTIQVRDSGGTIVSMDTAGVKDGKFSKAVAGSYTVGSTYTVYVADYEGGAWETASDTAVPNPAPPAGSSGGTAAPAETPAATPADPAATTAEQPAQPGAKKTVKKAPAAVEEVTAPKEEVKPAPEVKQPETPAVAEEPKETEKPEIKDVDLTQPIHQAPVSEEPQKSHAGLIVTVIVLVALIGGGLAFFLYKKKQEEEEE